THTVGRAAALLPRRVRAIATWFRKEETAVSNSKAESNCARHAPLVSEIDSTLTGLVDSHSNDSAGRPPFSGTPGEEGRKVKMEALNGCILVDVASNVDVVKPSTL
ncbi:hypothetical protein T484DRAFT_1969960, partial [Baffinella frigidus]